MRECPAVARQEIERLQERGYRLSLDDLAWPVSLGERVESPPAAVNPLTAAVPVVAGCEPFFRLTNQAHWWLDLSRDWFEGLDVAYAMGFAHRFGRTAGAFDGLLTRSDARAAVHAWGKSLSCTIDELLEAVSRLRTSDAPARQGAAPYDAGRAVAMAEGATGITRDQWATRTPDEMHAATFEALKLASEHGTGGESDAATHSREALVDLLNAVREIEARGQ